MARMTPLCLALLACLLASSGVGAQAETAEAPKPVYEIPLVLDGQSTTLPLFAGDTVEGAVGKFAAQHGLGEESTMTLRGEVTRRVVEAQRQEKEAQQKMQQQQQQQQQAPPATAAPSKAPEAAPKGTPVYKFPVQMNAETVVPFFLYEGDNLVNRATEFGAEHKLTQEATQALFDEALRRIQNAVAPITLPAPKPAATQAPAEPIKDKKPTLELPLTIDGKEFKLDLYTGDNLLDRVKEFIAKNGLAEALFDQIYNAVRNNLLERQKALEQPPPPAAAAAAAAEASRSPLYQFPVTVGDKTLSLKLFEGDVLGQAVESFVATNNLGQETIPILIDQVAKNLV